MKYNTIKIASHPRSGSHWIMRLIDLNFFDGKDYLKHYGGHPFGNEPRSMGYFKPGQAVIYTYRNLEDTTKSVYKMRHRFGLEEDNYDKFRTTPMSQMYSTKGNADVVRDTMKETTNVTEVDALFRSRTETVPEYMAKHRASWKQHNGRVNFLTISYDDLVADFHRTMMQVAEFLGSDRTEFVDEEKRVGWRAKSDDAWKKP